MLINTSNELRNEFRRSRGQSSFSEPEDKPQKRSGGKKKPYDRFKDKYNDLENTIDTFNAVDLLYYFREVAGEEGFRYVITNYPKDTAIFKRVLENYEPCEVCGMIDFLYRSDQDYLEKNRVSPNLLVTSWVNTIYADTQLWIDDKYTPRKSKKSNTKHKREWTESTEDNDTRVGGWE